MFYKGWRLETLCDPGFEGQITISLRSEAQHPKGGPQGRGIYADPQNARFRFLSRSSVRAEVSKPCFESRTAFFAKS